MDVESTIDADVIPMELDLTVNGPPADDDESPTRRPSKFDRCCSETGRYARIVLPHVGLVLLLGVYTVCGAGLFHVIEAPHEAEIRRQSMDEIYEMREVMLRKMFDDSFKYGYDFGFDEWREGVMQDLENFTRILYNAYQAEYVTVEDIIHNTTRTVWTFPQAIFFATTVITTIGYGNMVPRTVYGRIICIVFGLFGIPLLLITIADIGKFLSDLMNYLYRSYHNFKRQIRRRSKILSMRRRKGKPQPQQTDSQQDSQTGISSEETSSEKELQLPMALVLLVVLGYTALGGALFRALEGWPYFDAFYFCFITMVTIGFGDIVPSRQAYMFITIGYIVIGLALTTMCIDLAGTEYIQKIHYFGQKIEDAKDHLGGAVVHGLQAGEHLLKHTGYAFVRTAGGRLVRVPHSMFLSMRRGKYHPNQDGFGFVLPEGVTEEEFLASHPEIRVRRRYGMMDPLRQNILFSPISPEVERILKPHIKLKPEEIKESDAYILQNKTFNRPILDSPTPVATRAAVAAATRSKARLRAIKHKIRRHSWPRKNVDEEGVLLVAPFILKESKV